MSRSTESEGERFRVGENVICYRRGSRWWAEFYDGSRQRRESLRTTSRKEAVRRAARIDVQLTSGAFKPTPAEPCIADVIDGYLQKAQTEDRALSTIKRYRPELARWREFFQAERVTRLSGVTLALVEKYRAERKPHVAAATLYHETVLIKQILNYAQERGFVSVNSLKKLKLKRLRKAPATTYTLAEVEQVIAHGDVYADLFELLAFCGIRFGEARWLTWRDVELDDDGAGGVLHVRAKPGEWRPKDGDDRSIPLHPRVARMLAGRVKSHRFVFTARPSAKYPRGGNQISNEHVLLSLKRLQRRLGIAVRTVHGFRHFFVSFCANHGVEPFKLIQWTGHSDLATVLRYYNLTAEESRRTMRSVPFDGGKASAGGLDEAKR